MKNIFLFVLLVFIISACDTEKQKNKLPSKPDSVPESANWVGGLDGGVFVLVKKIEGLAPNEYWAEIYYVSGDQAYKGKMHIYPHGSSDFDYRDPKSYQGWDGDTLYIVGEKQLKVMTK